LRRAKAQLRAFAPMSDALIIQSFTLATTLVACLNLVLIGALACTKR